MKCIDLNPVAGSETEIHKNIEDIMCTMKCPKEFVCYTSGFKKLCRARDIGLKSFVACLARDPLDCKFSIHFGEIFFCQCPLRIYISKCLSR
jgi:hypothetical protein